MRRDERAHPGRDQARATLFQELAGDPVGQRMFGRRAAATPEPAPDPATEPDAASNGRTRKIAIVPPKTAGTPR